MAARFWVTQPASAIADNGSGKCRVTVASTTGMTTGDSRLFYGFTGTTGLNGLQTITVIDGTHVDVSAVSFVATGTGSINGAWDATNTNNWVSSSGGTNYGQTVPGAADDVTINASSGSGQITVNTNFSIGQLTTGAMGLTLDFGTNNNSPTIAGANGWVNNGAGTRTINLGSGTFTINPTNPNSGIDWGTTTGLTMGANTATFLFTGSTANGRLIDFGGSAISNFPSISFGANASRGAWTFAAPAVTIPTLTISAPSIILWGTSVAAVTNMVFSGASSSSPIQLTTNSIGSQRAIPLTNSASGSWLAIREINPTTGTITATNSLDLGRNGANVLVTPPSSGGSVGMTGG